jgi:uncharacterized protein YebE (UPF0316 family)
MELLRPLLIASLVLTEVGIWQWRMVIAHRGNRLTAMLLGILGAVLQITAITQVVAGVHDPLSIVAYAAGVGLGVLLGLVAGERLTPGLVGVTVITTDPLLARGLWELGWSATAQTGEGEEGPVTIVFVAMSPQDEARLHNDVHRIDPGAFVTTEELRARTATQARPSPAVARPADTGARGLLRPPPRQFGVDARVEATTRRRGRPVAVVSQRCGARGPDPPPLTSSSG